MPPLSITKSSQEGSFSGAPLKLLFCLAGSILALYLNTIPALAFLAIITSIRALRHLDIFLLIKVWLALLIILFICLAGVAWLPSPTVFAAVRGGPGPGVKAFIDSLPPVGGFLAAHKTLFLIVLAIMAAYFVYLAVKGLIKKDLWYFVQGSLFLIFAVMLLATILAMALSLSSLSMPRGWSALGRSLVYSVMPALRMMISANLALVLVLTTPSASLSRLLATIIKADWLFIPLTVVLRFLAAFLAQLGLVREALLVRTRRLLILTAICHPAILWRGLIVPMTFQTLKTADQLAISLEMKGLTRKALFWPRPKLFTKSDVGAIVTALIVLAVSITLRSPRVLAFLSQKVSF